MKIEEAKHIRQLSYDDAMTGMCGCMLGYLVTVWLFDRPVIFALIWQVVAAWYISHAGFRRLNGSRPATIKEIINKSKNCIKSWWSDNFGVYF